MNACAEAVEWASRFATPEQAWAACERGDWMLWLVGRAGIEREKLVLVACECARLALPHTSDERVKKAIEVTEAWARGEVAIEDVRAARQGALAARTAAYAAAAAAAAAYAAYAADARATMLAACADIVRKFYPAHPEEKSA